MLQAPRLDDLELSFPVLGPFHRLGAAERPFQEAGQFGQPLQIHLIQDPSRLLLRGHRQPGEQPSNQGEALLLASQTGLQQPAALFGEDEFVGAHQAAHQVGGQPPNGIDQDPVRVAASGIGGEHHSGGPGLHQALHQHPHGRLLHREALDLEIDQGPLPELAGHYLAPAPGRLLRGYPQKAVVCPAKVRPRSSRPPLLRTASRDPGPPPASAIL